MEVKVTNGDKIHVLTHTDASGDFSLKVKVSEIDGSYYVLVGDSTCVTKKVDLSGYGQAEVDLGTIEIEGPSAPVVETKPISDVSDNKATCGGNVTSDGRSFVTARGVCWSKSEYPTIDDSHTTNGSGMGEFKSQLTGLEAGATYYVRAYATNSIGTSYGQQVSTATATGLPQVTTDEVTNIFATSATCGGDVAANSGYAITARGVCWSDKTATPTIDDAHTSEVATTGHFTSLMIGLERNTSYYVRAYAVNERGTNYGEAKVFTTLTGLPTVTTSQVTNIKASTATCGGNVTDNGGYAITARGVCWSKTSSTPTIQDSHTSEVADNGAFTSLMTNLEPATTYYIRAYATNEAGTSYGNAVTFTSGDGLPTLSTTDVMEENIIDSTILTGGQITDDGGYTITNRGICWSFFPYPSISDSKTTDGQGVGFFSSTIANVDFGNNTSLYIRAYATNTNGTAYGNQIIVTKEKFDYVNLPKVEYGGYSYRLFPDIGTMDWQAAVTACDNLVYGGYSDWYLPSLQELLELMNKTHVGWSYDFITEEDNECCPCESKTYATYGNDENCYRDSQCSSPCFWSATPYAPSQSPAVCFYGAKRLDVNTCSNNLRSYISYPCFDVNKSVNGFYHVRPVRKYLANQ